jgi:hypothetical protein
MNITVLKQSRFLTKDDFGLNGKLVTIKGDLIPENVAPQDEPEEIKHLIFFEEFEKGMVLNSLNAQLIAKITGSDDTENWNGHKVVAFHDPTVVMRGKLTGGIRIRAPKVRPAQPGTVPAQPAPRDPRQPSRAPAPHNTAQRAPAPAASEPSDNDGGAGDDVPY